MTESEKVIDGIKKSIFIAAGIIIIATGIIYFINTANSNSETKNVRVERTACPANILSSNVHVKTAGQDELSQTVPIPIGCDFRVTVYGKQDIRIKTFPDEEIHSTSTGIKKIHKNNPEEIAFLSKNPANITITFYPFGTLKR